jgi:hypothetical protein
VLADPVQAAARQDTAAPLMAKAAAILANPAIASALPRPVLEAVVRALAGRLDLNRAPLDGRSLRDAVLSSGTLRPIPGQQQPATSQDTLLALRSALARFLGGEIAAVAPVGSKPPPPLKGEPARAPQPVPAMPLLDEAPDDAARELLGHTDATLARTKLLQQASGPDPRPAPATPAPEFRFEIPMLLGAQTGILQLMVERDGRSKPNPRERGWRMRFALNFSATGEVGADIALLGRAANVALWAAEPETAATLEAMLPELAPVLASHGLDVAGLRVRRGAPPRRAHLPGQLLDSAR